MYTGALQAVGLAALAFTSLPVAATPCKRDNLTSTLHQLKNKDVSTISSTLRDLQLFLTIEEHWAVPALINETASNAVNRLFASTQPANLPSLLIDAGDLRFSNMSAGGVKMQWLSSPASPAAMNNTAGCMLANNQLSGQSKRFPGQLSALAVLPMVFPDDAAAELERAVTQLGFPGALIDGLLPNGSHYDSAAYDVFWAKAEELGVPIYLHPTDPPTSEVTSDSVGTFAPIGGDFSDPVASVLALAAWGWHQAIGLHFLRLYAAGVFVRYPKLKIVLGHMGEMVPFYLERADSFLSPTQVGKPSLIDTWANNVWITTSGIFSLNPMASILRNTATDRIIYSVDYPFSSPVDGLQFMSELLASGMVSVEDWEKIAFGNVETLFGLK